MANVVNGATAVRMHAFLHDVPGLQASQQGSWFEVPTSGVACRQRLGATLGYPPRFLRVELPEFYGTTTVADVELVGGPRPIPVEVGNSLGVVVEGCLVGDAKEGIVCLSYRKGSFVEVPLLVPGDVKVEEVSFTASFRPAVVDGALDSEMLVCLASVASGTREVVGSEMDSREMRLLQARVRYLEEHTSALGGVSRQNKSLESQLVLLQERYRELQNSLSWRVTAPLRIVRGLRQQSFFALVDNECRIETVVDDDEAEREGTANRTWDSGDLDDYADWVAATSTSEVLDAGRIQSFVSGRSIGVAIGLVLALDERADVELVGRTLDSLKRQVYQGWRCTIVTGGCRPEVSELASFHAARDGRLSVMDGVGSRVELINAGLAVAEGEYLGILQAGDVLAVHALAWYASEIVVSHGLGVIYADHDYLIEPFGRREPHFKPDWNPELALSVDYVAGAMLVEGRLLRRLGHLNPEYPAFSEWDLVLRASRLLKISQIGHVPAVLHHLVAREHGELAEARAVRESFLAEEGRVLRWVSSGSTGFELPAFEVVGAPRVAVIVPTRDSLDDLRTCIESLGKTHYENHEVVVVDNQSGDPATLDYLEFLAARPGCRVIRYPFAFSYAALHNFVVEQVEADYICLLNNDTEITDPDWLATMLGYAQRDGTGAVGVKLVYPSGGIQHAGVVLGPGGLVAHVHRLLDEDAGGYMNRAQLVQNYSVVTAACMLVSKANWERVGGMCEQLPIAYNDVDFCLRLVEAGLRNVYLPQVKVIHYESKSRGPDAATHGRRYWSMQESGYLQWRWGHLIKHDPAYNANLSLYDEHFRLAEPRVGPPWSWKFAWLNVPGGFHPIRDGILSVLPNETVHFACLLPGRFSGTIGALRLPVDIIVGAVDGIVILEVELDGSRVASVRPLNRISRQTVVTFEFDDHEVLETSHGGTLHCTLTLVKARFPIALPTYPATEEWSHQLEGLPNHALHIEVGVRPPVDLIA